jgi:CubicO group peptidase (beta-lactamase class C family)
MSLTAPLPDAIAMPILFQPGNGWAYGGGLDCIGLLISRLTSMTLGTFMRQEIFDVVGCDERIGFHRQDVEKHGQIVQCVMRTPAGTLVPSPTFDQKSDKGGGGLFASARNFGKILRDLCAKESKLLGREMLEALFDNQLEEGSVALEALRGNQDMVPTIVKPLAVAPGLKTINHGLGGVVVTEDHEVLGKTKGTLSWGGAFGSFWFVNREQGVAAFYGSSMFVPGNSVTIDLMGDFVRDVWSKAGCN